MKLLPPVVQAQPLPLGVAASEVPVGRVSVTWGMPPVSGPLVPGRLTVKVVGSICPACTTPASESAWVMDSWVANGITVEMERLSTSWISVEDPVEAARPNLKVVAGEPTRQGSASKLGSGFCSRHWYPLPSLKSTSTVTDGVPALPLQALGFRVGGVEHEAVAAQPEGSTVIDTLRWMLAACRTGSPAGGVPGVAVDRV